VTFDVVLSSLLIHHLPDDLKVRASSSARVLKPGGRALIVDIKCPTGRLSQAMLTLMLHSGLEHGIQELPPILRVAGFMDIDGGNTGFHTKPRSDV
jgi:ubiquinone/menaquinone biosynthesis C-methylase UbiE